MKILSVRFNNRKKSFEVTTRSKSFLLLYVKADPAPTADDSVVRVRVDEELARSCP